MLRLLLLFVVQAPALPGAVDYPRPRFRTDSLASQLAQGWANRTAKPIACVWGHVAQADDVGSYLQFDSLSLLAFVADTPEASACRGAVAVLKFIERRPGAMPEVLFFEGLREQIDDLWQTRPDLLLVGVVHDTQRVMLTVPGDSSGRWHRPAIVTVPRVFWLIRTTEARRERPKRT